MHDPMCVAFELFAPIPKRQRWIEHTDQRRRERGVTVPRWTLGRRTRTNPENLGEPVYPWWRPSGYSPRLAGRAYGLRRVVTVWHVEPDGRDSGEVCKQWRNGKPDPRWKLHVRHWHLQVHPWQRLRGRFTRCGECGRRMNRAPRHGYMNGAETFHRECMDLRHLRSTRDDADAFIDHLFHAYRVSADLNVEEAIAQLLPARFANDIWRERYRMQKRLGWDHDHMGQFVYAEHDDG